MLSMMYITNTNRLWSGQKGWDYPSLCTVSIPLFDFDLWYQRLPQPPNGRNEVVLQILKDIVHGMRHFERNIADAFRAAAVTKSRSSQVALHDRLLPLLRFVIEQHIRLFMNFRDWVNSQNLGKPETGPLSDMASVSTSILKKVSTWEMSHGMFSQTCTAQVNVLVLIALQILVNYKADGYAVAPTRLSS